MGETSYEKMSFFCVREMTNYSESGYTRGEKEGREGREGKSFEAKKG